MNIKKLLEMRTSLISVSLTNNNNKNYYYIRISAYIDFRIKRKLNQKFQFVVYIIVKISTRKNYFVNGKTLPL